MNTVAANELKRHGIAAIEKLIANAIKAASALSIPEKSIFVSGDIGFSKVTDLSSRIIS